MSRLANAFVYMAVPPVMTFTCIGIYSKKQVEDGPKVVFKSVWNENFDDQEKLIAKREPLIQAIQNMYGKKVENMDTVSQHFIRNVVYEDPWGRCENREFLLKSFYHNSKLWKSIELKKFEIIHSQKSCHILCERKITDLHNNVTLLPSTIHISFSSSDDEEKIRSLTDYWNNAEIVGLENSKFFGRYFIVFRKTCLYFLTQSSAFRTFIENSLYELLE